MASLLNMSGSRLVGGKKLPYDAEIEWLESTGTQWVDTKIPTSLFNYTKTNFKLVFSYSSKGVYVFGGNSSYYCQLVIVNDKFRSDFAVENRIGYTTGILNLNEIYTVEQCDGVLSCSTSNFSISRSTYPSGNFYLFKGNGQGNNTILKGKIYSFIITERYTSKILAHFIPVRVGQVGYMYDKVSGKLFGNAGTGAFILGPDKTN